ncbi:3-phosphoshikimate 1-carboxyvinyltransferase [Aquimarina muelleri]|uniref:3-phosphoshikimate 1-carboxyvinyltransferase n=1 Tax=Aquimarina muelleri TaxID=279356 RepID=A0A918N0X9_9FLAO|nr:3-phosphoshikimate 1-carboxyvinyltransferase [Aquimarina muelleri]MCX2763151.1 3-phosphoshikimate 1-carboxyvinyltransferase [Aquimarina muelleri]GGX06250.1 3-phosphoshikimate 1-carboxyvinyltransferase [Aquimarina muelleri]
MNLKLDYISNIENKTLQITGSKSETNRLLILQALYPNISIENVSNSDDSELMQKALRNSDTIVDIHHAGTAMRFLTAYFAIKEGKETVLTGSKRMKERPIKILVEALQQLGCEITYENEKGYPPIKIHGKSPTTNSVSLQANVSSQYISALMLIASSLSNGLEIFLEGKVTSVPYINMTLSLLSDAGIEGRYENNKITINYHKEILPKNIVVESDWSSASYFYSIVALSENGSVTIGSYKKQSYQGDSSLVEIYKNLGVDTVFNQNTITIKKNSNNISGFPEALDLSNSPDIAQTIVVTCFGLGVECCLTGLHTLKIKETDRLEALKTEIEKFGGRVNITKDSLYLESHPVSIKKEVYVETYNDHRMAMAFAPLALKTSLFIKDANVVSKSYPDFWSDLEKLGFRTSKY